MRPTLLSALLVASVIPACLTPEEFPEPAIDPLAVESDPDAGKDDSAGAFTYFTVTPDLRACSFDTRCGGYYVARPNHDTTRCADGVSRGRCYVDTIDWAGTAMPASVADSYEARVRTGESMILRGELAADAEDPWLAATEIWVAGSATGVNEGIFVIVQRDDDWAVHETRLNSTVHAKIGDVDLNSAGADEPTVDRAYEDTYPGAVGVIAVGYRFTTEGGRDDRMANQFYVRAKVPQL